MKPSSPTHRRLYRGQHKLGHQSQVLSGCITYGQEQDVRPRDWTAERLDHLAASGHKLRVCWFAKKAGADYESRVGMCRHYRIFLTEHATSFAAFENRQQFRDWLTAYGLAVEDWKHQFQGCRVGLIRPTNASHRKPLVLVESGWVS